MREFLVEKNGVQYSGRGYISPFKEYPYPRVRLDFHGKEVELSAYVMCFPDDAEYERVKDLSARELIDEAISIFSERYPFGKIDDMHPWRLLINLSWSKTSVN